MQVVIVGAGIIGAALAYALSRHGAAVTVVDSHAPAAGATGRSFGWINASFYADAAHFALRAEGIEAYRRLCRDLDLPVTWAGCVCWENEAAALEEQTQELQALGYAAKIIERADFARLEPNVRPPQRAVLFETEAAAEPGALTQRLLAASGARVISGCAVDAIETRGGKVSGVRLMGDVLPADRVIVAAGTDSVDLLAGCGVALPLLQRPGAIFQTAPLPPILSHVCVAPIGEFRQNAQGCIVMPTAVAHQADDSTVLSARPDVLADAAAARLQDALQRVEVRWQQVAIAARPVPQDGVPVVGACGPNGLHTAVMHSGVTLGPVVAEVLAAQVMDIPLSNAQTALIAPYAPDRFQNASLS